MGPLVLSRRLIRQLPNRYLPCRQVSMLSGGRSLLRLLNKKAPPHPPPDPPARQRQQRPGQAAREQNREQAHRGEEALLRQ